LGIRSSGYSRFDASDNFSRKEISRRGGVLFGILSKSQLILILLKSEFAQVRQVNFHVVPTM